MIVGFVINKIESARHVPLEEPSKYRNINGNYDINLGNLSAVRVPMAPEKVLRLEYSVTINYINPSIGFIRFEGFCDHTGGDAQKTLKDWEQGKPDIAIQNIGPLLEFKATVCGAVVEIVSVVAPGPATDSGLKAQLDSAGSPEHMLAAKFSVAL